MGSTSHAAVVSRALDTPCVVGCGTGTVAELVGKVVTVDADGGKVFAGDIAGQIPKVDDDPYLQALLRWARRTAKVRVVADPADLDGPVFDADRALVESDTEVPEIPAGPCRHRRLTSTAMPASKPRWMPVLRVRLGAIRLPVLLAAIAYRKDNE